MDAIDAELGTFLTIKEVQLLTFDELADAIGEQRDKLLVFVRDGVIVPNDDGRFELERSVADYWAYWRRVVRLAKRA
jgi:hypothetical protein